ncbi:hypothetical protein AAU57_09730 [Nonlabens sp. YIK11]|uniref:PepSY-like domain-containing protein n=1 Tax=Nonlabens sp. YIK11 TaxID=1453349 RepID=UPI0006DC0119|nr:PepSY-like domain-containing protein [Nonlabens sp. YIK11]KQC33565.1 hypothetical protein AAU57_09730 [Nonlabens sp. YIK11]
MKIKIILILGWLMVAVGCIESKETKVPQSVVATFVNKYPTQENPKWIKDENGLWEAQFESKGERLRAGFQQNGLWVETEYSVNIDNLPAAVVNAVNQNHQTEKIVSADLVHHYNKGIFYDLEIQTIDSTYKVEYRKNGMRL